MIKDKSKLVAKQVVDKTGKKTTVWVKNGEDPKKAKRTKKEEDPKKKPKGKEEQPTGDTHIENPFKDMAARFKIAAAESALHRDKFLHQNGKTIDEVRAMSPEEKAEWNKKYAEYSKENPNKTYSEIKDATKKEEESKKNGKVEELKEPKGKVEEQEDEVVADLKALAKMGQDAKKAGEKAPNFNLCKISIPNTNLFCEDNKGIKRQDMPQLKGKAAEGTPAAKLSKDGGEVDGEKQFQEALAKKGVKIEEKEVKADSLKATQNELVGVKVGGMMMALEKDPNHAGITAPILVSKDGYVLDGHHRWAAIVASEMNTGKPPSMSVKQVDMNIEELVKFTNKWTEEFGIKAKAADANKEGTKKKSNEKSEGSLFDKIKEQ